MREKLVRLKRLMAIVVAVQLGILLLLAFVLEQNIVGALIILITEGAFVYYLFVYLYLASNNKTIITRDVC